MLLGFYKDIAAAVFGKVFDRYGKSFNSLKPYLMASGIGILLRTWVCIILLSVTVSYFLSLLITVFVCIFFALDVIFFTYLMVFVPILVASFVFMFFYLYPMQKAKSIERSIETNLPFALANMSAIASSGIPPEFMFELLIGFKEYGAIADQAKMIVRNTRTLGMNSVSAINSVAKRTPSKTFRQVLMGITSTIEKGGNLVNYLRVMSDKALFEYSVRREEYLKTLSTYADIYTALAVAAPLMMLAVLGIMSIIGGEIMGLSIQDFINVITWVVLPFLNIAFLVFIHLTYPGI